MRLATYTAVPFPYPMTYQSDGAGGLVPLPPVLIPTAVLQGRQPAPGAQLHPCGGKGGSSCQCHGACGPCKRLQARRRRGRGLRGLGDDSVSIDPITGLPDIGPPPISAPGPSTDPITGLPDIGPPPIGSPGPGASPSSSPGASPSGTSPNWASLIAAGSQAAGRIIASTRGMTPQQFAAQNPQLSPAQAAAMYQRMYSSGVSQASMGAGFNTKLLGIPVWGWGIGIAFVGLALRGGK